MSTTRSINGDDVGNLNDFDWDQVDNTRAIRLLLLAGNTIFMLQVQCSSYSN